MKKLFLSFVILLISSPALAAQLNAQQEKRFNELGKEIRCVVCQSEPVATSSAQIALDMRQVIKDRILAGDSDAEVRQYFSDHYGEYVLLRPQINKVTYLLWFAPLILLGFGAFFAIRLFGKSQTNNQETLTEDELKAAEDIISNLEK